MTFTTAVLAAAACLCGVAPERENDFFWENDKVGFRAYGPGNYHVWSGIDLFNKMPDAEATCGEVLHNHDNCGNWHTVPYKGILDNYTIGASRGVGGVALFGDGEWKTYPTWEKCEVIESGEFRCVFKLVYPSFSALGKMTCRITLVKGSRFFRNEVSFEFPDRLREFRLGPGLDVEAKRDHKGDLWEDAALGIVSLFEEPKSEDEGSTMTAIILDPTDAGGVRLMTDRMNCRVLALHRPTFAYYAGGAWSKAGEITTPGQWREEVRRFRDSLAVPTCRQ